MIQYKPMGIKKVFNLKSLLTGVLFFSLVCNVYAAGTDDVKKNIIEQAKQMGVEPAIVLSIAKMESGFNQSAKSACGNHIGVFQLSHATAKRMGLDPYKLEDNIKGGITYYKQMYEKFGSMELAVAAYNSGPDAIMRNNNTIPKHSQNFVNRIMSDYKYYKGIGI